MGRKRRGWFKPRIQTRQHEVAGLMRLVCLSCRQLAWTTPHAWKMTWQEPMCCEVCGGEVDEFPLGLVNHEVEGVLQR